MNTIPLLILFLIVTGGPARAAAATSATEMLQPEFRVDGSSRAVLIAGEASDWRLRFLDNAGDAHLQFMKMHAKYMHMIVVKSDLSSFAHIHPVRDPQSGTFAIRVNSVSDDPDNYSLPDVVPEPGMYHVFSETMPVPVNEAMPMLMSRFEVEALSVQVPGAANENRQKRGKHHDETAEVRYFRHDGSPGEPGDRYRVTFSYINQEYCGRWLPGFYFTVLEHVSGSYEPVTDWVEWLEMGGHSIMISKEEGSLENRKFFHFHAFLPMAEPGRFTFPYDHHRPPLEEGEYKIWGQFKRGSQVFTFPFVFRYETPPLPDSRLCRH